MKIVAMLFGVLSSVALSSEWSPDCEYTSYCQRNDVVEICAINRGLQYPRIKIKYFGYLKNSKSISAYTKLNGLDGFYSLVKNNESAEVEINKVKAYLCETQRGLTYPPCKYTKSPDIKITYEVEENPSQRALFKNATKNGKILPWEIEVAITDNEEWDSNYGQNYHFYFD